MQKISLLLLKLVCVCSFAAPCWASSITVSSIGPGGSASSSAALRNLGTISHVAATTATSAAYQHYGGYIHALSGTGGLLPSISFSPGSLLFSGTNGGSDPAAQPLSLVNSGGSTLAWTVSKNASWLAITPTSGSNAGLISVAATVAGLTPGTYTDTITISGIGARSVSVGVVLTVGGQHTLSLQFGGTGSGYVTSTPGGLAANTNSTAAFSGSVTLHADPAAGSVFSNWSGDCSGGALDCTLLLDADKVVTASFTNLAQDIRIRRAAPIYFTAIQAAYLGAQPDETIELTNTHFPGPLHLTSGKAVTMVGGYAGDFSTRSGYTTLGAPLTVSAGKLVVDRLIVR